MPGYGAPQTGWTQRLLADVRRDRKKTALMCGLLVVAAIVVLRAVLKDSAPAPAAGETAVVGEGSLPGPSPQKPAPPPAPAEGAARRAAPKVLQARHKISQDLFAIQLKYFPQDPDAKAGVAPAPTSQAADSEQARVAAIRAKAQTLSLQSTIISSTPRAVINGQLVGVGEWTQGFQVIEVTARACVLVQDGVRVQLDMKDQ
jgi:hypothetical protein